MLIAIASDDGMTVAEHPDRCGGFVIFEIGSTNATRVGYRSGWARGNEKNFITTPQSTAMISGHQALIATLSDCDALVSRRTDGALMAALRDSGIEIYVFADRGVDEAAQCYVEGRLRRPEFRGRP